VEDEAFGGSRSLGDLPGRGGGEPLAGEEFKRDPLDLLNPGLRPLLALSEDLVFVVARSPDVTLQLRGGIRWISLSVYSIGFARCGV